MDHVVIVTPVQVDLDAPIPQQVMDAALRLCVEDTDVGREEWSVDAWTVVDWLTGWAA